MFIGDGDGLLAIPRLEYLISAGTQELASRKTHGVLVFNHKQGFRAFGKLFAPTCDIWLFVPGALEAREVDLERSAQSSLAVDPYEAAALLDDAVHGRQPETRAFSFLLRREEGTDVVRQVFRRDAFAGCNSGVKNVLAGDH